MDYEKTTAKTTLSYKASSSASTYTKLCDITSYPDLYAAPERLDITTLTDETRKYTKGIADAAELEFGFIYDKSTFTTLKGLESNDDIDFKLEFGTGDGATSFTFKGSLFANVNGGGVGDVREGTITLYPSTAIVVA